MSGNLEEPRPSGPPAPWCSAIVSCILLTGCAFRWSQVEARRPHDSTGGPEQPAAPKTASDASSSAEGTLGIGHITQLSDGTSASFDAYEYFESHRIRGPGGSLDVTLVDHPSEAEYVISGRVESDNEYAYDAHESLGLSQLVLGTFGGSFSLAGAAFHVVSAAGEGSEKLTTLGTVFAVAGGISLAAFIGVTIPRVVMEENEYHYDHRASIVLRHQSQKVATIELTSSGEILTHDPLEHVNRHLTRDLWAQLKERIEREIVSGGR